MIYLIYMGKCCYPQSLHMAPEQRTWERRFFATTRGKLVALLRARARTVEELSQAVGLTDNAVRSHLATLERDGLVQQEGVRRGGGLGKPAFDYALTSDAEALFPKAYGELLRQLLRVLADRLEPEQIDTLLHELARRIVVQRGPRPTAFEERVSEAVAMLEDLGGCASCEATPQGYLIVGRSCPLTAILPGNPDACRLAELLLTEATGSTVHERCRREPVPRCEFEVVRPAA